ncbi:MAG: SMC-Scp complex subunit ScpB [Alloalcanivorax sp.]
MDAEQIKRIVEAAILVAEGPLDRDGMLALFDEEERPSKQDLSKYLEQLAEEYEGRGIFLKEVASGFRFQARSELGSWVSRLWQEKPPRYSRAILETLALIAYRQPITRGEIEEIRGVSVSSHIVKSLLERNWVRVVGHRDVPGRPAMFATTKQFLDYFDLKSLEDLPSLAEIRDLDKLNEELALTDVPPSKAGEGDADEASEGDVDDDGFGEHEVRLPGDQGSIPGFEPEPEIDDSTQMSMDKVDSVLASFEQEFRRKPGDKNDAEPAPGSNDAVADDASTEPDGAANDSDDVAVDDASDQEQEPSDSAEESRTPHE